MYISIYYDMYIYICTYNCLCIYIYTYVARRQGDQAHHQEEGPEQRLDHGARGLQEVDLCVCVYICIYVYIEREIERERYRYTHVY